MSNSTCIIGPPFSLTGNPYFPAQQVSFQLLFDTDAARQAVMLYEWYLNGKLIIGQRAASFAGSLPCGSYNIGVRILSAGGWSGVNHLKFETCKQLLSSVIAGPDTVKGGDTAYYNIVNSFADGSVEYVTADYIFTAGSGTFSGNAYTAPGSISGSSLPDTITAVKAGETPLTKQITITNATPVTLVSLTINGPDAVDEGASVNYAIIAVYSNGSTADFTADYVLSCPDGSFLGGNFIATKNKVSGDTRSSTISASKNGIVQLIKQITINDTSLSVGILVVDLFNDPNLNVIGLIDNAEVSASRLIAHSGKNIVPQAKPAGALILASDVIEQPLNINLKWRFEFNIEKLVHDFPGILNFAFYIKGRSNIKATLTGAFNLKSYDAVMTLSGQPGSYLPSVTGGDNLGAITNFSSYGVDGANGSYNEVDLTTIIWFNYNVAGKLLTYFTHQPPITVSDFDFMTIRYNWITGDGNDLDILVGFENNGTTADGIYVGYGQPNATVPANTTPQSNAYLWWGSDNTTGSGYEAVLVGLQKFVTDFPSSPDVVQVGIYAVWFGAPQSGNFTVELVTYKGGAMSNNGTDFINTGGVQVSSNTVQQHTLLRNNSSVHTPANTYKVGTLKYIKSTQSAIIEIN